MTNISPHSISSIAVIGTGYWGKNLVRNYHSLSALRLICDSDRSTLQYFQQHYPEVETCLALSEVLSHPDICGIAIATPAETHFRIARESLLAGKHVFVEKPLALSEAQGNELIALAERHRRILMVGHLLHYHPVFVRLKEMALSGEFGRINYIYSHRLNLGKIRREENILWSFAPHDISMILSLAADDPESILATGINNLHQRIADVTTTHLEFSSGLKAHIFVSWLHPFKEQKLVVVGDRKMVVFDDTMNWDQKLLAYPHEITWRRNMPVPSKAEPERFTFPQCEPLKNECIHFLECIRTGKQPTTDGREGVRVLQVLNAAQASLDQGGIKIRLKGKAGAASGYLESFHTRQDVFVHESAYVDAGVSIGSESKVWHFSHIIRGSRIGERCTIGQNVVIGPDVTIGNGCKIQNNVSVYKGVTLEDDVFCGPSMVFTNVFNPRANIRRMDEVRPTLVRQGASIGANSTIVCGITIGKYAFIGAGAVVTRDVPNYALMMGNPARRSHWMCSCGVRLDDALQCQSCGQGYSLVKDDELVPGVAAAVEGKKLEFISLGRQQERIRPALEQNIRTVLAHGKYIMGPEIQELEKKLAGFAGTKHAISCSSGTDALLMLLMAKGVGPGDAVFTTPFTFTATAEVIALLGATPVFVDIDPRTFNIDATHLQRAIQALKKGDHSYPLPAGSQSLRPAAVIPVDMFGLPADYDALMAAADAEGLFVIEDAAQSFGASYKGRRTCSFGHAAGTSFFPAKPLGCYGDGGAVFTADDDLAHAMESIRVHGKGSHKYDNARIGLNARLDTMQAAILLAKLAIFPEELEERQRVANRYTKGLISKVITPQASTDSVSAWAQYSILTDRRDEVQIALKQKNIPTAIYYPKPLHLQTAFAYLGYKEGDFPASERCSQSILSLPMHPYLSNDEIDRIIAAVMQSQKGT